MTIWMAVKNMRGDCVPVVANFMADLMAVLAVVVVGSMAVILAYAWVAYVFGHLVLGWK